MSYLLSSMKIDIIHLLKNISKYICRCLKTSQYTQSCLCTLFKYSVFNQSFVLRSHKEYRIPYLIEPWSICIRSTVFISFPFKDKKVARILFTIINLTNVHCYFSEEFLLKKRKFTFRDKIFIYSHKNILLCSQKLHFERNIK